MCSRAGCNVSIAGCLGQRTRPKISGTIMTGFFTSKYRILLLQVLYKSADILLVVTASSVELPVEFPVKGSKLNVLHMPKTHRSSCQPFP